MPPKFLLDKSAVIPTTSVYSIVHEDLIWFYIDNSYQSVFTVSYEGTIKRYRVFLHLEQSEANDIVCAEFTKGVILRYPDNDSIASTLWAMKLNKTITQDIGSVTRIS